ncbi:MAG: hypothetical protein PHY26_02640 [Bacilli bacterium]|nr:hypothetical protein [Bacilli bacterium]
MINEILKELGISKVKLAKFLGVSRQMVYNYLEMGDIDAWPKDKKMRMFMLLNINSTDEIKDIKITSDYIMKVENVLNNEEFMSLKKDFSNYNIKNINKKNQEIIMDLIDLIKEHISEDETGEMGFVYKYLLHYLQLLNDAPELKYALAYFAKANGFVSPKEFAFDEDKQITFEGIMFQAMVLFYNGGASKSKIGEAHKRFIADIEQKKEEKLSRTQELNTAKIQALKELGYTEINSNNASEVFEKIAEIQARRHV